VSEKQIGSWHTPIHSYITLIFDTTLGILILSLSWIISEIGNEITVRNLETTSSLDKIDLGSGICKRTQALSQDELVSCDILMLLTKR